MNDISAYDAIKDQMNTGDIIEFQGTSIISKEIRARTGFDTNHSALVVVMKSPYTGLTRRYMYEAVNDGVDPNYLSVVLSKYDGVAFWYPMRNENVPRIPEVEERAFQYLGVAYDYKGLITNLFGHGHINTHALFCSEFVQLCWGGTEQDTAWWPGEIIEKMNLWKFPRVQLMKEAL